MYKTTGLIEIKLGTQIYSQRSRECEAAGQSGLVERVIIIFSIEF